MNEFERLQLMHHQEYLLKQNEKKLISKWQKARKLIKAVIPTLNEKKEANMIIALKLACEALIKRQVEEENPPLKKIALDSMNGEPVWVVSYNHDGRWGIVDTADQSVIFYIDGEIEREYWFDGRYIFKYKKEIFDHTKLLEKYNIKDEEKKIMTSIDFSKHSAAQDMVRIIMRDKSLSVEDALNYAINKTIYQNIIQAGYASIALDLWGHGDPEREWDVLENPIIKVELDKLDEKLVEDIMKKENVDLQTAISYFLLFTMEALGYHI